MTKIYDYLVLGGGMGGLSIAALLAKDGKSVCVLEGHDVVGGYAHTLRSGPYSFCHQVQYIMGCRPGGPVHRLMEELDLLDEVTFNALDDRCFDLVNVNGKRVEIPHGMENFEREMIALYPGCADALHRYFAVIGGIFRECRLYEKILSRWDLLLHPFRHPTVLRYRNYTLHDLFEELGLPPEVRAILAGQAGNLAASPKTVSLPMHAGMQGGYCDGAYFPAKGMDFLIGKLQETILRNGGEIRTSCSVTGIRCEKGLAAEVATTRGELRCRECISDIDPQRTMRMLSGVRIPRRYARKMNYLYSDSVFNVYLGLKDIDLRAHGFSRRNIWHHSLSDLDEEYDREIKDNDFSHPWIFLSTPSLNTDEGVLAPAGCGTMEILTFVKYDTFRRLSDESPADYEAMKERLTERMFDIIERSYLPELRAHIDAKIVHTPVDLERMLHAPEGNVYGCQITPRYYNLNRITGDTPIANLHLVGATASYHGTMGVMLGSLELHDRLKRRSHARPASSPAPDAAFPEPALG